MAAKQPKSAGLSPAAATQREKVGGARYNKKDKRARGAPRYADGPREQAFVVQGPRDAGLLERQLLDEVQKLQGEKDALVELRRTEIAELEEVKVARDDDGDLRVAPLLPANPEDMEKYRREHSAPKPELPQLYMRPHTINDINSGTRDRLVRWCHIPVWLWYGTAILAAPSLALPIWLGWWALFLTGPVIVFAVFCVWAQSHWERPLGGTLADQLWAGTEDLLEHPEVFGFQTPYCWTRLERVLAFFHDVVGQLYVPDGACRPVLFFDYIYDTGAGESRTIDQRGQVDDRHHVLVHCESVVEGRVRERVIAYSAFQAVTSQFAARQAVTDRVSVQRAIEKACRSINIPEACAAGVISATFELACVRLAQLGNF